MSIEKGKEKWCDWPKLKKERGVTTSCHDCMYSFPSFSLSTLCSCFLLFISPSLFITSFA